MTGVSLDAEFLENIAEKLIDLFFSDLIREVFYNDLHDDDGRRSKGKYEMEGSESGASPKMTKTSILCGVGVDPTDVGGQRS